MLLEVLKSLFDRDLNKLKSEILAYKNENVIWDTEKNISNSAGNLCLHLVGNLNAFIGAELGNTGYIRQRDLEFSLKDVPRDELIQEIDDTILMLNKVFDGLSEEVLQKEYPKLIFDNYISTEYFLIHLSTHLTYHLGQINYHRRLLNNS
jgi:hypothetical protein